MHATDGNPLPIVRMRQGPVTLRQSGITVSTVPCVVKSACGSCSFVNTNYRDGLLQKHREGLAVLDAVKGGLARVNVIDPVGSIFELRYRTLAKLAVRSVNGKLAMGLFAPQSHNVVDIDSCPIHVETIRRLLADLREEFTTQQITPYDEATQTGELRYIVIRAAHQTDELQVTFVARSEGEIAKLKAVVQSMRRRFHRVTAAHVNINEAATNAIFGATTKNLFGNDFLRENICGLRFDIGPKSFFQVNPWMAEMIYRRIVSLAERHEGNPVAWDLYSGVGQISLQLARAGFQVCGIEEIAAACDDARHNAALNALDEQCEFLEGRTEDVIADIPTRYAQPQVIVANPSRRGMTKEVCAKVAQTIERTPYSTLLYMSCDVTTLARDIEVLRENGLKLRQVEAFDMFAQTDGLEWLAVLTQA